MSTYTGALNSIGQRGFTGSVSYIEINGNTLREIDCGEFEYDKLKNSIGSSVSISIYKHEIVAIKLDGNIYKSSFSLFIVRVIMKYMFLISVLGIISFIFLGNTGGFFTIIIGFILLIIEIINFKGAICVFD